MRGLYERDAQVGADGSVALHFEVSRPKLWLPEDPMDVQEAVRRHEFYRRVEEMLRRGRETDFRNVVPGNAYVVNTGASAIALGAASAKTIMYINAAAANQFSLTEICVGFDGTTSTNTPVLCELCFGTKASNSTPGTGSTTFTPLQIRGWPAQASVQAAANNCSSEPTVLTSIKQWLVSPYGGLLVVLSPLGREPTSVASGTALSGNQVGLRTTAPQTVNTRGYLELEE
jgi:hypothetical protein